MSKNRVYLMAIGFVVTFTAGLVIKQALIPGIALLLVAGVIGWFVIQDSTLSLKLVPYEYSLQETKRPRYVY